MFIRRLYYNSQGEVLHSYMMQGNINPIPADVEAARLGLEDWSVMEWFAPDPEIERSFTESYGRVSVDLSGEEPVIVFDFSPIPEPDDEQADMRNALSILGVEV